MLEKKVSKDQSRAPHGKSEERPWGGGGVRGKQNQELQIKAENQNAGT